MFELMPFAGGGRSLGRLLRDMDDLWGRFFDNSGLPLAQAEGPAFMPTVNVKETENAVEVTAEVPGLKPEEIEVNLTGNILTLKGEKKDEKEETQGSYHLVERRFGSFQRSFRLPMDLDRAKVQAKHKDGVLTVTLPKAAKETSTAIKVEG